MLDEIGKAAREKGVAARGLKKWSAGNAETEYQGGGSPTSRTHEDLDRGDHSLARPRCDFGTGSCPGPFAMPSVAVIQKRQATSGRRVSACASLPHCGYLAVREGRNGLRTEVFVTRIEAKHG